MKLYFAPNTCSLSPHIVLRELGLDFQLVRVNNQSKRTADGEDFRQINPKGYVAALALDNGEVLTEGPAILQYLVDLAPEADIAPEPGSWQRVRFNEWLSFIATEIHAGCAPLFNADIPDAVKAIFRARFFARLDFLQRTLSDSLFLLGRFSAADAYLFAVLEWLPFFAIDIGQWPALASFQARVAGRDSVRQAVAAEAATEKV
ncbi:glutathione transferase GstA [Pseudomonas sp. NPDC090202]|uniref:glutathione transferase GstA n=1 Tax=unclassified Pseudomonas TaxID=196821 RepID=UPI0038272BC3